jgi:hypothetical protein
MEAAMSVARSLIPARASDRVSAVGLDSQASAMRSSAVTVTRSPLRTDSAVREARTAEGGDADPAGDAVAGAAGGDLDGQAELDAGGAGLGGEGAGVVAEAAGDGDGDGVHGLSLVR